MNALRCDGLSRRSLLSLGFAGALGWSLTDIALYRQIPNIDSIDSITYYLAAQRGERWCKCCADGDLWTQVAIHHAQVIVH